MIRTTSDKCDKSDKKEKREGESIYIYIRESVVFGRATRVSIDKGRRTPSTKESRRCL